VLGVNIIGLLIVAFRRDIVWCVGATWVCISIFTAKAKPSSVYITTILFTVLHPLVLIASSLWIYFNQRREGRGHIALPPDDETTPRAENGGEEIHADWT